MTSRRCLLDGIAGACSPKHLDRVDGYPTLAAGGLDAGDIGNSNRSLGAEESQESLVPPRRLGGDLRLRQRRYIHLSRELVRARPWSRMGMRLADHRRQGDVWDRRDSLRAEIGGGPRKGLFDDIAELTIPPLDSADGVDVHLGVISGFVRAVRAGTEPETVGHDNIRSLAMAPSATASAASTSLCRETP
jgi:hypothetical protein